MTRRMKCTLAVLAASTPASGLIACGSDDGDQSIAGTETGGVATDDGQGSMTSAADGASGPDAGDDETGYPESDTEVWELRTGDFSPPVVETWYSCFSFTMDVDRLHHIIGFEPVVSDPVIHHYILSISDRPVEIDPSAPCFEWPAQMIWGWAPGIEPMRLPSEAGILVGDNPGSTVTLVLQVHYNNPLQEPVPPLDDGLDVILTPQLRPNDAFVWSQGDIGTISIPPGEPSFVHTARCEADLTQNLLDHPIHVFASFLHAHQMGTAITSELYRGGELVTPIASRVPYSFDAQQFQPVDLEIRPGDALETRCTYDSTGRDGVTVGGTASRDEMCINFMMYYPRVRSEKCGSI